MRVRPAAGGLFLPFFDTRPWHHRCLNSPERERGNYGRLRGSPLLAAQGSSRLTEELFLMSIAPPDYERRYDPADRASLAEWITVIRSEYLEMPGLHLTGRQAQRLWNLDPVTCEALLTALVETRFLRRTPAGAYARADCGSKGAGR